jgi:hypothetical protein
MQRWRVLSRSAVQTLRLDMARPVAAADGRRAIRRHAVVMGPVPHHRARAPSARLRGVTRALLQPRTVQQRLWGCHECGRVTTWCRGGPARTDVRPCTHRTFRLAKAAQSVAHAFRTAASHDHGVAGAPRMDQARSGAQGNLAQVERGPLHPPVHAQCELSLQNQSARGRARPRWAHAGTAAPLARQRGRARCRSLAWGRTLSLFVTQALRLDTKHPGAAAAGRRALQRHVSVRGPGPHRHARAPRTRQRSAIRGCYRARLRTLP